MADMTTLVDGQNVDRSQIMLLVQPAADKSCAKVICLLGPVRVSRYDDRFLQIQPRSWVVEVLLQTPQLAMAPSESSLTQHEQAFPVEGSTAFSMTTGLVLVSRRADGRILFVPLEKEAVIVSFVECMLPLRQIMVGLGVTDAESYKITGQIITAFG